MEIKELVEQSHNTVKEKGFWDKERNVGEMLMLIVSELGEALEAHRHDKFANFGKPIETDFKDWFEKNIKDSFCDEIADVFIRLGDLCGGLDIDIEKHIIAKMKYNKTREKLHGKKY
jgi:NTP pyrophosphatase (non-canonical NTP hydrolase)